VSSQIQHDDDFYGWSSQQAQFLKNKEYGKLDMENLIDEVECLGKSEKRMLESYLENLLMHMLKVKYQPEMHTRSWDLTIKLAGHKVQKTLTENPSLKYKIKEIFEDAYYHARLKAMQETALPEILFPVECPWSIENVIPEFKK